MGARGWGEGRMDVRKSTVLAGWRERISMAARWTKVCWAKLLVDPRRVVMKYRERSMCRV